MSWQDVVFAVGNLVFVAALIPSVRSKDKPHFLTSTLTALVLLTFAFAYLSLELYGGAATVTLSTVLWSVLAYQKLKLK